MCRLCGFTFTNPELIHNKARWLDRLMLVSQTDENQNDGWGITDGVGLWRSEHMYSACVPKWDKEIDPTKAWMAHIRKASAGTGHTLLEAHPYKFTINGNDLYCAHNGQINGTTYKSGVEIPNTDSYRAFLLLTQIMETEQRAVLTSDLFSKWMEDFIDTSQLAMLFHHGGHVVALRKDRPLHCASLGNGYVIHTSKVVLEVFKRYLRDMDDVETGDIVEIPVNNMAVFPAGENTAYKTPVDFKMRTYTWGGNNQKNAQSPASNTQAIIPIAGDRAGGADTINGTTNTGTMDQSQMRFSVSVTRPKVRKDAARSEDTEDESNRLSVWREILDDLAPLRSSLVWLWAAYTFGYPVNEGHPSLLPVEELMLWRRMLPRFAPKQDSLKPRAFTDRQYQLINQWNHLIKKGKDSVFHNRWLGEHMFWMLPRYLELPNDQDAVKLLVSDVARYVVANKLDSLWSLSPQLLWEAVMETDLDVGVEDVDNIRKLQ